MIAAPQPTPATARASQGPGAYVRDITGLWADIPAFTAFAQEVHDSLLEGELLFSRRQKLLKCAKQLGVRSFDANLIIAMVQNRVGIRLPAAAVMKSQCDQRQASRPNRKWLLYLVAVLITQSAVFLLAWSVIRCAL
jgi:hypothetical protein